ncbi:S9 family peptidase [Amycolatopsis sp. lyj-90]|uniref:S9 family peptidase n=1 Tax=Amycolatopsis sp. lyj-90 TaxID=2789285 RepID=UPI0039799B06
MTERPRVEDLARVAIPSQPALSPDGDRIVYVLRTQDVEHDRVVDQLWLVPVKGGSPRRLSAGSDDTAPTWSPDGGFIVFLRGGQLTLLEPGMIDPEQLTSLPLGAGVPVWSPDGRRLAFAAPVDALGGERGPLVSDDIDYQHSGWGVHSRICDQLHVLDLDSRELRQLTDGPHSVATPAWSPDGSTLAYVGLTNVTSGSGPRAPVYLVEADLPRRQPQVLAFADGLATTVSWSGDGSALLVTGWSGPQPGRSGLYRVAVVDGATRELAGELDRDVISGKPSFPGIRPAEADGRAWFCLREQGWTQLWSVAADGGYPRPLVDGDAHVTGLSVGDGVAAIALSTSASFGEIAVVDLVSGTQSVLTDHGAAAADLQFYSRQEVWFTLPDGAEVRSWLLCDHDRGGPMPLLLDIHGGPCDAWNGAADDTYFYHQELVSRGWAVLLVNPRGSDGHGPVSCDGIPSHSGIADPTDLLEPINQLVADGFVDRNRLAVTGHGSGGVIALWLTGHDARFAAAAVLGAVDDPDAASGTCGDRRPCSGCADSGSPGPAAVHRSESSLLDPVSASRTPTVLLYSAGDRPCLLGQAQQWHAALRERDVPARLVVYPDTSHRSVRCGAPSLRIDYNHRLVDWIEQHIDWNER